MKIEGYMMIGHHTLVTIDRGATMYRITTWAITPQDEGNDVEALLKSSFTEFRRCQYATTLAGATSAFASVVASELTDEHEAQLSLAA